MAEREDILFRHGRARDRSIVVVLCGAVALLPPIVSISLIDLNLFGIPLPVVYVFSVWIALIVGAAILSRSMAEGDPPDSMRDNGHQDS